MNFTCEIFKLYYDSFNKDVNNRTMILLFFKTTAIFTFKTESAKVMLECGGLRNE